MFELWILIWFAVILLAFLFEVFTLELVSVWFAFGGILSFILALFGLEPVFQVVVFITSSIGFVFIARPHVKKFFMKNKIGTNSDALIDTQGTCTKEIRPFERGEVRLNSQNWTAISAGKEIIVEGDIVVILAFEGNKLIVEKR